MKKEITIAPPNSLVLLMDYENGEIPEGFNGGLISSTSSCVAIGTLPEIDGLTYLKLSDDTPCLESKKMTLIFDGTIYLGGTEISLCTSENQVLISLKVRSGKNRVEIYANDKLVPDRIFIFIKQA